MAARRSWRTVRFQQPNPMIAVTDRDLNVKADRRYARLWAQGRCRVDRADLGILRACEPVCAPQIAGAFVTLAMRP